MENGSFLKKSYFRIIPFLVSGHGVRRVDAREERGEAVELAQLHDDLAHRRGAALGHAVVDQHGRIAGRVRHGFAEVNGRGIL